MDASFYAVPQVYTVSASYLLYPVFTVLYNAERQKIELAVC